MEYAALEATPNSSAKIERSKEGGRAVILVGLSHSVEPSLLKEAGRAGRGQAPGYGSSCQTGGRTRQNGLLWYSLAPVGLKLHL
jgi:hypothetical protein